jgi:hypothetical protein
MATRVRPSRRAEPTAPRQPAPLPEPTSTATPEPAAPHTDPETTLGVDHLGLWLWLGGVGILLLLHLGSILSAMLGWWK